ncbi:hypothetical protein LCGC14_2195510, partial [marine sediment metagenome]
MEGKIDVFNLFNKEQLVKLEDDTGLSVEILLVKLTQGERRQILDLYRDTLNTERQKLIKREEETKVYSISTQMLEKEQFIDSIMQSERVERQSVLDLFPVEDEKELSQDERLKKQDKELKKWDVDRKKELNALPFEDLQKRNINIIIENLSVIEAARCMDLLALSFMCKDSKTKEPIFKNAEHVEAIKDKRVIDKLHDAMRELNALDTESVTRKAAESSDFTKSGESPKNSTESQPS